MLRANVEVLRLIQVGLTFTDEDGNPAEECPVWQFNFRFSLEEDLFAPESVELLRRSGLDFANHQEKGIEAHHFAEVLMTSGLVLCDDIKWLTFHSAYDFGYLLRLLTNAPLPGERGKAPAVATAPPAPLEAPAVAITPPRR
jgi:CCR4-NOT transcription complex subunit 7/8